MIEGDRLEALVVAHPGHELRIHGWLSRVRPIVFVLTDGSGASGRSRLGSTTKILGGAGATPGPIYGALSDAELYAAVLAGDAGPFVRFAEELARTFTRFRSVGVAGDALEGYNPAHDLCRYCIDAAVAVAWRDAAVRVESYEFPTVGRPDACPEGLRSSALWLSLTDHELAAKRAAAESYPELAGEVEDVLRETAPAAFRVECLRPVATPGPIDPPEEPPYYERFGEERVAAGRYTRVLRYREHVRPIAEALRQLGTEGNLRRCAF